MVKGMNSVDEKSRRAQRRRNHIAKDLGSPKYRQQVVPSKRYEDEEDRRWRRYKNIDEE